MAADVRSIAELRDFHAGLITYRSMLQDAMASIDQEIRRAFDWMAEMKSVWQHRASEAYDDVVKCKAELSARKVPRFDGRMPDCSVQEEALRRAKAKLEYCEDQVKICQKWINKLPKEIEEAYEGAARRLGNALEIDMANGLTLLGRRLEALEAYADLRADFAPAPSAATLPTAPSPAMKEPAAETPASE